MKPRLSSLLVLCLMPSPVAFAQPPVQHERVDGIRANELDAVIQASGNASALIYDNQILPEPEGGQRRSGESILRGSPADSGGSRRSPTFRPDRQTTQEQSLRYYPVFTPEVTPFKRISALDAVIALSDGTPILGVSSQETRVVPIEQVGSEAPDRRPRERFWGTVVVDFASGSTVPLPSISPESRVLSLRSTSLDESTEGRDIQTRVERDDAGSYFIVATSGFRGTARIVYMMDAPVTYFRQALFSTTERNDTFASEVFAMPARVERDALTFARELGLERGTSIARTLVTLTDYFRSFEEGGETSGSSNIFLDLAHSRRGVCRHRSYVFVIVAQALGMPARFVQNEAHAWAEVRVPLAEYPGLSGWLRVDLGGAVGRLDPSSNDDRPQHRPQGYDALPRPPQYVAAYSMAAASAASPGSSGTSASAGAELLGDAYASLPPTPDSQHSGRRPILLTLDESNVSVLRGRSFEIRGRATNPDSVGVAGLRVEVYGALSGETATPELLGVALTREDGYWQATIGVPSTHRPGRYEIVVRSLATDLYLPAVGR